MRLDSACDKSPYIIVSKTVVGNRRRPRFGGMRPVSCDLRLAATHCLSFSRLQQVFIPFTKRPVLLAENGF